jgi:hypothetical protein
MKKLRTILVCTAIFLTLSSCLHFGQPPQRGPDHREGPRTERRAPPPPQPHP